MKLSNEVEFPRDPLLNLLLFEYQEFLHQPGSMTQFVSQATEENGPYSDIHLPFADMEDPAEVSKYAHVFNQICEIIKLEEQEYYAQRDLVISEIEAV